MGTSVEQSVENPQVIRPGSISLLRTGAFSLALHVLLAAVFALTVSGGAPNNLQVIYPVVVQSWPSPGDRIEPVLPRPKPAPLPAKETARSDVPKPLVAPVPPVLISREDSVELQSGDKAEAVPPQLILRQKVEDDTAKQEPRAEQQKKHQSKEDEAKQVLTRDIADPAPAPLPAIAPARAGQPVHASAERFEPVVSSGPNPDRAVLLSGDPGHGRGDAPNAMNGMGSRPGDISLPSFTGTGEGADSGTQIALIPAAGKGAVLPTGTKAGGSAGGAYGTGSNQGSLTAYAPVASSGNGQGEGSYKGVASIPRGKKEENSRPVYPQEARRKGYQGEVLLRVEVLPSGRVGEIEVKKSSGHDILDRSATAALKGWKFTPAKRGETAVAMWVNIPVRFELP
jgi:TonB family protein